jgi:hypothetical protein
MRAVRAQIYAASRRWRDGKWAGAESNRRHEDFQSSALPTELPAHKGICVNEALSLVTVLCARQGKTQSCSYKRKIAMGQVGSYYQLRQARLSALSNAWFYQLVLNEIDDMGFETYVIERVDLLYTGRTGDVHFGEIIADNI